MLNINPRCHCVQITMEINTGGLYRVKKVSVV